MMIVFGDGGAEYFYLSQKQTDSKFRVAGIIWDRRQLFFSFVPGDTNFLKPNSCSDKFATTFFSFVMYFFGRYHLGPAAAVLFIRPMWH